MPIRARHVALMVCLLAVTLPSAPSLAQQPDSGWSDQWGYGQSAPAPGPINPRRNAPYDSDYDGRAPSRSQPYRQQTQEAPSYPQPHWRDAPLVPGTRRPQMRSAPSQPRVITVPSSRVGANVVLGGTVVPYKEVTLAAQIPGRIEYIAGSEGDWFKKGDLLLAINDDDLLAKRQQAMAELRNADAATRNAQVQYSRELWAPQSRSPGRLPGMGMPNLFDQMFTRQAGDVMGYGNPALERSADLYSYGSQVSQAQARMSQARSAIDEVEAKLRDARAEAPFGGVITRKLVEVGDTVQPGQPMIRYADTRYLQLQLDVPARLVSGLEIGMILPVKLDIGDTRVDARVAQVFPIADAQRHTVTVKFDLPRDTPGGPGMYAEALLPDVNATVRNLPVIPYAAVVWRGSLPAVFVVDAGGSTELRMVRLGEGMGSDTVAVLSGLRAGEQILVDPAPGMASDWSTGGRRPPAQGSGNQ